ncbi:MAG: HupE/UreJ family protein [Gemmatimonadales bacterium]
MSEFSTFVEFGFRHITDIGAMDHILFLLALAVIYYARDWRDALWVVTAFTVGHSITLGLSVSGIVALPIAIIEFLIPVTIALTCLENMIFVRRDPPKWRHRYRPLLAGAFGLIHGAGFADYLKGIFPGRIAIPLLGFNIGVELGQLVLLAVFAALFLVGDALIFDWRKRARGSQPTWRVVPVSVVAFLVAAGWAIERNPW